MFHFYRASEINVWKCRLTRNTFENVICDPTCAHDQSSQCVVVCCSVLQCIAVRCSVLNNISQPFSSKTVLPVLECGREKTWAWECVRMCINVFASVFTRILHYIHMEMSSHHKSSQHSTSRTCVCVCMSVWAFASVLVITYVWKCHSFVCIDITYIWKYRHTTSLLSTALLVLVCMIVCMHARGCICERVCDNIHMKMPFMYIFLNYIYSQMSSRPKTSQHSTCRTWVCVWHGCICKWVYIIHKCEF